MIGENLIENLLAAIMAEARAKHWSWPQIQAACVTVGFLRDLDNAARAVKH